MSYYVRLLTKSEEVVPFSEVKLQVAEARLTSGTETNWDEIEILQEEGRLLAVLERTPVSSDQGKTEIGEMMDKIRSASPANAREWIRRYLSGTKTIYRFQLYPDSITAKADWQALGRVQNLIKDTLTGIIQADNEGYYNENGDYILWQMYPGAGGTIPAATLNERGEWISFTLKIDDVRAVERFKEGILPRKGILDIIFRK